MTVTEPVFILAILCASIALGEWLYTKPAFKSFGTSLIVIIIAAILANLGIIPTSNSDTPIYEGVLKYVAPIAIFLLMLEVKLKTLKKAGPPMLSMYLVGCVGSIIGVLLGFYLLAPQKIIGSITYAVSGMLTGTYIGGSVNFNAVALNYNVAKNGNLFAAANAVDNICSAVWIIGTIAIPRILNKYYPKNNVKISELTDEDKVLLAQQTSDEEAITPYHIGFLLALALISLFVSKYLSGLFPQIPYILTFTTIAIVLAQFKFVHRLRGSKVLGMYSVYLFLAVIGAYCNIHALIINGQLAMILLAWIGIIIITQAIIIFSIGALFKQDWDIIAIASQASIGGPTTALSNARSLGRPDLQLPAVLVGSLGYAIGTYIGVFVAEFLK